MTQKLTVFVMTPSLFDSDGAPDDDALRTHLRRIVAAGNGIYLSSGGAGEAHVLTTDEMLRICRIGVEEAGGRVPVHAGLRESRSAAAMYAIAKPAIDAGVDVVQLYQVDGGHGMIPTVAEQNAYWDELLTRIERPVALAIHHDAKFSAPISLLARLCNDYPQIVAFNLVNGAAKYFLQLRDAVPAHIDFNVALPELVQFAALGATGAINPAGNVIPYTCRRLADGIESGDWESISVAALSIQRYLTTVSEWAPSTARWVKMSMKVLGLGNGVLRPPYLLPAADQQQRMADLFGAIKLMEVEEESRGMSKRASAVPV